jgi:hypothetical protein
MDRATALATLLGAPLMASTAAARDSVSVRDLRAVVVVGDYHIGLADATGTLIVCGPRGDCTRLNVPRPPASQTVWLVQTSPTEPVAKPGQVIGDVNFASGPDEFAAVTRAGTSAVFAFYAFASHAYIVCFEPARMLFHTIALPFGGLVRAIYAESAAVLGLVRPDGDGTFMSLSLPS